ncbi:MAG: 30S ribosomal protein S20 [Myxococcota bacterium]
MANHKSAWKRHVQSEKRRAANRAARSALRTQVKKARAELQSGTGADQVKEAVQALAKAGGKGLLHKKTAARRISRLMKAANRAAAQG